jgi:release factor glutamine methyltransferase
LRFIHPTMPITVQQAIVLFTQKLSALYPLQECRSMARLYFEATLGFTATDFLLRSDYLLTEAEQGDFDNALARLSQGEPIQYVLGKAWFMDLLFDVAPGVLIPRPETEELVHWVASEMTNKKAQLLDIGTGSGCIAVSLAHLLPMAAVSAWDVSQAALAIASANALRNNCSVSFNLVDVLAYCPKANYMRFDAIVSNPPYVTESEKGAMHTNVVAFEPHLALFVGNDDPLLFYRTIAKLGPFMLERNGCLFFEINEHFGPQTVDMLGDLGYGAIELRDDINGKHRMVKAVWPH